MMKPVFAAIVLVGGVFGAVLPATAETYESIGSATSACPYGVTPEGSACISKADHDAAALLADETLECPVADNAMMLDEACLGLVYVEVATFKDMANGGGDSLLVKGRYWTLKGQLKVLTAKLQTAVKRKTECVDAVYDVQLELERAAVAAGVVKLPKKEDVAPQSLGALSDSGGMSGLGGLGSGMSSLNLDSWISGMVEQLTQDVLNDLAQMPLPEEEEVPATPGRRDF